MTTNELKFETFKMRWLEETSNKISSNPGEYYTSAYIDIIGMKYDALPCILNELVREGDNPKDWFYALTMITHLNPVPREQRGNLHEMAKRWIEWGYEKGIIKPNNALESLKLEIKQKFIETKSKSKTRDVSKAVAMEKKSGRKKKVK